MVFRWRNGKRNLQTKLFNTQGKLKRFPPEVPTILNILLSYRTEDVDESSTPTPAELVR